MSNLLKNPAFENGVYKTHSNWRYSLDRGGMVCIRRKGRPGQPSILFQDVSAARIPSNGVYRLAFLLLSPTPNTSVKPTLWVFRRNRGPLPAQRSRRLQVGRWNIVYVDAFISKTQLQKVRCQLYLHPSDAEVIINAVHFGKLTNKIEKTPSKLFA